MNRRRLLQAILALGALKFSIGHARQPDAAKPGVQRPNVLFISIDDLNDWVGFLKGNPDTRTPKLDRLAKTSVVFERAYCNVPACFPSRTSVLTGLSPNVSGIYTNADWMEKDFPHVTTLPATFRQHGYRTMGGGKVFHITPLTNHRLEPDGIWDEYHDFPDPPWLKPFPQPRQAPLNGLMNTREFYTAMPWIRQEDWGSIDVPVEEMPDFNLAEWAKSKLQTRHVQPFFLAVGFFRPHMPWYVPRKYFELFPPDTIHRLDIPADDLDDLSETARKFSRGSGTNERIVSANLATDAIRAYLANIAFVDECVGTVIDSLRTGPNAANTLVVVWSDNGFHLGEKFHWHKSALWEPATRVPLLFAGPESLVKPRLINAPVGLIDLYPTLCDLCGIPLSKYLDGSSLKPSITDPTTDPDRPVFMYVSASDRAVRFRNWRYIRYADGSEELYDMYADPDEFHNLVSNPGALEVMEHARKLLAAEARRSP